MSNTPPPSAGDLLSPEKAAKHLDIHPRTLRRIRMRGDIEFVRVGGQIRYSRSAIEAYIRTNTVAPRAKRRHSRGRRRA